MIVAELTRENYHSIHLNGDKPLVSSSALQYAYPGQGGSPARVGAYLEAQVDKEEEVEKAHQELGSLLHLWLENHNKFAVEQDDRPDPWICEVIDTALASALPGRVDRMEDLKPLLFPAARAIGAQPKWGEEAIVRNVAGEKGIKYFHWRIENNGKQMITASCREKLDGMQNSIANSPWGEVIIGRKHPTASVLNELPILWEYKRVPCKSLLDLVWVDYKTKEITINDFKTTSAPVGLFQAGTSVRFDSESRLVKETFPGTMYKYRYYRQTSFYELAMTWWVKHMRPEDDIREWKFYQAIFVVGSVPPYEVDYVAVPVQAIMFGKSEIEMAFQNSILPYYQQKGLLTWT